MSSETESARRGDPHRHPRRRRWSAPTRTCEAAAFVVQAAGRAGHCADAPASLERPRHFTERAAGRAPWRAGTLRARATSRAVITARPILLVPASTPPASTSRGSSVSRATLRRGASGPHRRADRPHPVRDHAADHRHDRRCRAVADPASTISAPDGRIGMMGISFARRTVDRGRRRARRCAIASLSSCRSAAMAICRARSISLHRHPAGRLEPAAARLRGRDHSARRRRPGRPGRAGGAAPYGDPLLPRRRRGSTGRQGRSRGTSSARARD